MSTRTASVFALVLLASVVALAASSEAWRDANFVPRHLLVEFDPSFRYRVPSPEESDVLTTGIASLDALCQEYQVVTLRRLVPDAILARLRTPPRLANVYLVKYRSDAPVLDALSAFAQDPCVRRVEPDLLRCTSRVPNDPYWSSQWDKRIMGAEDVWDVSVGSADVICAGIDTGVDWNHPDLTPILWVNPGEDLDGDRVPYSDPGYPGDFDDLDSEDNDDNGYHDDFLGWDFVRDVHNCPPGEDCDDNTDNDMFGLNPHGTHVAGIMVAAGNNGIGVCGMSWVGRLMALRAGWQTRDGQGNLSSASTLPAILYAAANGAKIINMSYGGGGYSDYEQDVLNSAWNQGCILVAASGNDGSTDYSYPANYDNVIAVNATDSDDRLEHWSNRGTWTDLCAPGGSPGVISTVINGYGEMQGTSMASPSAGGAAALVWSCFPNMSNVQLRDLLFSSAEDISSRNPSINPAHLGNGRVDAAAAVVSIAPRLSISQTRVVDSGGDGDGRLERSETGELSLIVHNEAGWADGDDVTIALTTSEPLVTITDSLYYLGDIPAGQSVDTQNDPFDISVSPSFPSARWVDLTITFSSPNGYEHTEALRIRVERGEVLVVDDDGGDGFESYYAEGIEHTGLVADVWSVIVDGAVASSELLQYTTVIWICGNRSSSTLTDVDQAALITFLSNQRNLILAGQNIDEDLSGTSFYSDVLHAQSGSAAGNRELVGVAGHPISDGMTLLLSGGGCAGNGNLSPSRVSPVGGAAAIFDYTQGGSGAIAYAGPYRVVYFAFALEAACGQGGSTRYDEVLASTLRWMGVSDAPPKPRAAVPNAVALHGNYPNPFNAATTISFDLTEVAPVRLSVYDLLGREVAVLVNERLAPGTHRVPFAAENTSSGVYVARLQVGAASFSSKMMLLK